MHTLAHPLSVLLGERYTVKQLLFLTLYYCSLLTLPNQVSHFASLFSRRALIIFIVLPESTRKKIVQVFEACRFVITGT